MTEVLYQLGEDGRQAIFALRDESCELGVINVARSYLRFAETLGIKGPVFLHCTLIDCEGARIGAAMHFRHSLTHFLDRSPCVLPPVELNCDMTNFEFTIRRWCDNLWQAFGPAASPNFGEDGKWKRKSR